MLRRGTRAETGKVRCYGSTLPISGRQEGGLKPMARIPMEHDILGGHPQRLETRWTIQAPMFCRVLKGGCG